MELNQSEWFSGSKGNKNVVIIDVRTSAEWQSGYIENAINLDILKEKDFIDGIEKLDKSKNYYLYCKAGIRSANACKIMNQLGFPNTFNLIDGIIYWDGKVIVP